MGHPVPRYRLSPDLPQGGWMPFLSAVKGSSLWSAPLEDSYSPETRAMLPLISYGKQLLPMVCVSLQAGGTAAECRPALLWIAPPLLTRESTTMYSPPYWPLISNVTRAGTRSSLSPHPPSPRHSRKSCPNTWSRLSPPLVFQHGSANRDTRERWIISLPRG